MAHPLHPTPAPPVQPKQQQQEQHEAHAWAIDKLCREHKLAMDTLREKHAAERKRLTWLLLRSEQNLALAEQQLRMLREQLAASGGAVTCTSGQAVTPGSCVSPSYA